jgi:hypothetical protein
MERFTSPQFRDAVSKLLPMHGHGKLASMLRARGVSFEDAYTAIFNRAPKPVAALDLDFTDAGKEYRALISRFRT